MKIKENNILQKITTSMVLSAQDFAWGNGIKLKHKTS